MRKAPPASVETRSPSKIVHPAETSASPMYARSAWRTIPSGKTLPDEGPPISKDAAATATILR